MCCRPVLWLLLCLFLVGCEREVLYTELTESEANEMVALLYSNGLDAVKVANKDGLFDVGTPKSSFSRSVAVLQRHGLPRERFQSLGDVFTKDGFISSPLEERARLNYALSQEIAKTISSIDGVLMARVHLAVPERQLLSDVINASSASVFVKHRMDADMSVQIGKIKSMVVTAFENLPYENVTVALFPAEDTLTLSSIALSEVKVDTGQTRVEIWTMLLFALAGVVLIAAGVYLYIRNRNKIAESRATHG